MQELAEAQNRTEESLRSIEESMKGFLERGGDGRTP